jgi:hypothetical protein
MTPSGLGFVLSNLDVNDEMEYMATLGALGHQTAWKIIWSGHEMAWEAVTPQGLWGAIAGVRPIWPGLCALWMMRSREWPAVSREVTRVIATEYLPNLERMGFHRMELRCISGNRAAERWLRLIGFQKEAVTAQFGRGREDFVLYSRTSPRDKAPTSIQAPSREFQTGQEVGRQEGDGRVGGRILQ